jgi:ubiquinone/menaquinone biosynthesis C-methylase UbiE
MGKEIDLLINYPKSIRKVEERGKNKTEEDRKIARKFDKNFFDGDRKHGYGGYYYHPRFWQPTIPSFQKHYNLTSKSSILDVGAGKGFMLYDFTCLIPGIKVSGIDISEYAVKNSKNEVSNKLQIANATNLPFEDNSFDLVISINTVHNLEREDLAKSLQEIQRVSKKHSFITVDAYKTEEEKKLMMNWNLTAKTIMHKNEWESFFKTVGYKGDYYWFIP